MLRALQTEQKADLCAGGNSACKHKTETTGRCKSAEQQRNEAESWLAKRPRALPTSCQRCQRHLAGEGCEGENESRRGRSQEATPGCEGGARDTAHKFANPRGCSGDGRLRDMPEGGTATPLSTHRTQLARFDLFIHSFVR